MPPLRKNIMLGTAGHVDHGKTALVKLLTGCETDTLAEEKQRGLTIDLGFAPCRLADQRVVGVVDVPGHVDFIRNMVAGAHGIDVVIFVVAADDGIMPQTHEHLHILTLMGVRHGLVALTKIDLVDAERRASVSDHLRGLLQGTFLENAPLCPISNVTGEGFSDFFDALNLVVNQCEPRSTGGFFRMWVEDVFTIRGSGTVVTGIPSSGRLEMGETLLLQPGNQPARVRRMQVYSAEATEAHAGECVAINLPELEHTHVRRGMLLSSAPAAEPIAMAEAELRVLPSSRCDLEDYFEAHVHLGTAAGLARVALLADDRLVPGGSHLVQLRLEEPLPLVPGQRFVVRANLRSEGQTGLTTIGGGRILGISNTRLRRKRSWTLEALGRRLEALDQPLAWCELMLQERTEPMTLPDLEAACHLRADELATQVEALSREGRVARLPDGGLVHSSHVAGAVRRIANALDNCHQREPRRAGLSRDELWAAAEIPAAYAELALQRALVDRLVEPVGAVYARFGWRPKQASGEEVLLGKVEKLFRDAGYAAPSSSEAATTLNVAAAQIEKAAQSLVERGILVTLDPVLRVHRDTVEAAQAVVLKLFSRQSRFTTMEFRDALGVSRKYAVPLLDHLDRLRFTVRMGHDRTPGVEARKRLA